MARESTTPTTLEACLQVHSGLNPQEIDQLFEHWAKLDRRLQSFTDETVELHLWVKDRDNSGQHVTLEAKIAHRPTLVATSSDQNLDHALNQVRDEMIRQLNDSKTRSEPRHNRNMRETPRH